MKSILIVDGNSILNRAFYGVKPLTTKDGLPTNAVFGMYNIITKNVSAVSPDYCVVAFDLKAPTFRHKLYDGYKANRKGMPEELAAQLPFAKECMRSMGFSVIELEGYEADDILGTVSNNAAQDGIHTYLLTGDRDSLQLIDENVTVLLTTNKETVKFDGAHFVETYGIQPSQFVDVKALMGDSSDNIPGVAGIGEKTALKLISDFGSLDSVYSSYSESKLTQSVKTKLENGKDSAYLSKKLALIERNAPIEYDLEAYAYRGIDKPSLKQLFEKLEFHALINKLGLDNVTFDTDNAVNEDEKDGVEEHLRITEVVVTSLSEFADFCRERFVSIEINDGCLVAFDGNKCISTTVDNVENEKLNELSRALGSAKIIVHDFKRFCKEMSNYSVFDFNCEFDTMLAAYCLNSNRKNYTLSEVYLAYAETSLTRDTESAVAVWELYKIMLPKVEEEGINHLLYDIELPLAVVLAEMETVGVKIDVEGIRNYSKELTELADLLKERIFYFAGEEFNIDSHKQLGDILFNKLGLPVLKKNKRGYSTDAEVLNKLKGKHDIIEDILDYRQVTKLISTYTEGLISLTDENSRIHSVFNQTGTSTGRLSSSDPNLQNIPVKTELGKKFRQFFIPQNDNYVIIDADYSQIELRLLAHISNDENMISAFIDGEDIHTSTAARVFNMPLEAVTPDLRKRAKAVNFGIVYGIGEYSLSEDLGISMSEAKKYIESYLSGYPKVRQYLSDIKESAKANGYVTTMFSRRRYIPEISASNKNLQHFGERVAMNSPIQGSAADIIKLAMINVRSRLIKEGLDAKIILQVHDELLLEANKECANKVLELLVEEMQNVVKLSVPLEVDAHIGDNWFEAK